MEKEIDPDKLCRICSKHEGKIDFMVTLKPPSSFRSVGFPCCAKCYNEILAKINEISKRNRSS
jgi:hypothetical protein